MDEVLKNKHRQLVKLSANGSCTTMRTLYPNVHALINMMLI